MYAKGFEQAGSMSSVSLFLQTVKGALLPMISTTIVAQMFRTIASGNASSSMFTAVVNLIKGTGVLGEVASATADVAAAAVYSILNRGLAAWQRGRYRLNRPFPATEMNTRPPP